MTVIVPSNDARPAQAEQVPNAVVQRPPGLRPRTVVMVLAITLGALLLLSLGYLAWQAITWILIAAFLAMALNPAVDLLERRGLSRGPASAATFVVAILVFAGIGFLVIPPLVGEVVDFVEALPGILRDLENGRGPLGFLERKFDLVERLERALADGGVGAVLGFTTPAIGVAKTVATTIFSLVAIAFLTFFLLLDGRRWVRGFLEFVPDRSRPRWERVFAGIYRTVGGYVTGNLAICVLAGVVAGSVMAALGVPYAIPLAIMAALFNLVPMIGAPIAAAVIIIVTLLTEGWVDGLIVLAIYAIYQQIENHAIQPLVYGRAVNLSPLAVLVSVLVGAQLGGVLGAIAAIPVGGSIAVVATELMRWRRESLIEAPAGVNLAEAPVEPEGKRD
jgi:predicted PurR-regulated permease PerM